MKKSWELDIAIYPNEESLLEGLRRQDAQACTCLFKHFASSMYHLALQVVETIDEAEDVLQESLMRACTCIRDFKGQSELSTWLHRIVFTTALMQLRKSHNTMSLDRLPGEGQEYLLELPMDQAANPSEQILAIELREMVAQAFLKMAPSLRQVLILRAIDGMSTHEVAQTLGISESAVKVRLHRARLALHRILVPYLTLS